MKNIRFKITKIERDLPVEIRIVRSVSGCTFESFQGLIQGLFPGIEAYEVFYNLVSNGQSEKITISSTPELECYIDDNINKVSIPISVRLIENQVVISFQDAALANFNGTLKVTPSLTLDALLIHVKSMAQLSPERQLKLSYLLDGDTI